MRTRSTLTKLSISLLLSLLFVISGSDIVAQQNLDGREAAPEKVINEETGFQGHPETPALWNLHFAYNSEDSAGAGGQAGVVLAGNEYWVSYWQSDTLARFAKNGSFLGAFAVTGVSNIRGMTFDGTKVYAANNTNLIYMIDTATKASLGTITAPLQQVRHVAYDPTANSNQGGLYVGNWNTNIVLMSLTGSTLSTISAAVHGLTGMYGSAYDGWSTGGPYLWIFDQNTSAGNTDIVQLQLPSGSPTGLTFDVTSDPQVSGMMTGALAGGLFATDNAVTGKKTLVCLLQGTPDNLMIGYELGTQAAIDGSMINAHTQRGYMQVPEKHIAPETLVATVRNQGTQTIAAMTVNFTVRQGGATVYTGTGTGTNLAPNMDAEISSATTWTPSGIGTYVVSAEVVAAADSLPGNDSTNFTFMITDSTFARDDGNPLGGLGYAASNTAWSYTGALWDLEAPDTLTSVWIQIQNPNLGDTTYIVVASVSNGQPLNIVSLGNAQLIDDNQNDYVLTLNGDLPLDTGSIFIGVYEVSDTTINLAHSNKVYIDGMNWLYFQSTGWIQSSIETARFIRPNFGNVGQLVSTEPVQEKVELYVAPNPSRGLFTVGMHQANATPTNVSVLDVNGKQVASFTSGDVVHKEVQVDLSQQAAGTYFLQIEKGTYRDVIKVMIMQ